jgi:YidC/Oxa1 family membrane protein insertase
MFTTLIAQPIFNLLVLIYAILPGHNLGLAIIIFTIIVRLLLWPLVKRQLHQTKAMRRLQPQLKRIKKEAKGDRQKESVMVMALYKEHGVSPFGSIGILILQLPILIALYDGLRRVISDPHQMISFAYPGLRHLPWMQELARDIHKFDGTLFGVVDLTRSAVLNGVVYWPALVIVVASAVVQYFQSKQLLVTDKNARSLRAILRDAGKGQEADQGEVSAAVGGVTRYFIPLMVLLVTVRLASALGLYWLVGGLIAYIQQSIVLREDETELEALADGKPSKKDTTAIPEAEIVTAASDSATKQTSPKTKTSRNKKKGRKQ